MSESLLWSRTLQRLGDEQIRGVSVVAVRDDEPDAVASHIPWETYVRLEHGVLCFESVGNHGGLQVRHVDGIDLPAWREEYEGWQVIPLELDRLFLGEGGAARCLRVDYVTNVESDLNRGIVRCVEMHLSTGRRIFIDPWDGLGNPGSWMRPFEHESFQGLQRHTWSPR